MTLTILDHYKNPSNAEENYAVIVCAFNESGNLAKLLPKLESNRTILVDDGSTDGSASLARSMGFDVLVHPRRLGKTTALRDGISYLKARGYDIAVDLGADAVPEEGSIKKLIHAVRRQDVGGASARQIPIRSGTRLAYSIDEVIWAVLANGKNYQMRKTGNSYLGAVMFSFKLSSIRLLEVTNDDEFIGSQLNANGQRVVFVKDAIVYFDASVTLRHIVERRKRMYYGHLTQRQSNAPSKSLAASIYALWESVRERPSRLPWTVPSIVVETFARLQAWRDYRNGKDARYRRWVSEHKTSSLDSPRLPHR